MISILVPIYNTDKFLSRCIESILAQTYTDFELLLINDGSTDKSGEICDRYSLIDKRIRVFHKKNEGISATRNFALDNAKGEYIGWVDSDDWIARNMYENMYTKAKKLNLDIIWCDFIFKYPTYDFYSSAINDFPNKIELIQNYLLERYNILMNTLVKKKIYDDYNIRCKHSMDFSEDLNITTKILYFSVRYKHLNEAYYYYNKCNPLSITSYTPSSIKNTKSKICNTLDILTIFSPSERKQIEKYVYWKTLNHKRYLIINAKYLKDLVNYVKIKPMLRKYIFSNPSNQGKAMKILEFGISFKLYPLFYIYKIYILLKNLFNRMYIL